MDILNEPQSDDRLCSAVYAGTLPDIEQAVKELTETSSFFTLARAMCASISTRNFRALEVLLEYGEVDEDVAEAAAASESIWLVQLILNHGWPINRELRGGLIPSMLSLGIRNDAFLGSMLTLGADPNVESGIGETALSFAIREGTMNVIRRLLDAGADTSKGDLLHCVSLREASEDTHSLVAMLIERGTPVDTYQWDNDRAKTTRYGYPQGTALHVACKMDNRPAAEALLKFGADPRRLKKKGERLVSPSPLDMTEPQSEMRKLLEGYIK